MNSQVSAFIKDDSKELNSNVLVSGQTLSLNENVSLFKINYPIFSNDRMVSDSSIKGRNLHQNDDQSVLGFSQNEVKDEFGKLTNTQNFQANTQSHLVIKGMQKVKVVGRNKKVIDEMIANNMFDLSHTNMIDKQGFVIQA